MDNKKKKNTTKKRISKKKLQAKINERLQQDAEVARSESMFKLYLMGMPISKIAKLFGITRNTVYAAKDKFDWDRRKLRIDKRIQKRFDKEAENYAWMSKKKRAEFLEERFQLIQLQQKTAIDNFYRLHSQDPLHPDVGRLSPLKDIERLFRLFHQEINDGVARTETTHSGSIQVGPRLTVGEEDDRRRKMLLLIAGGKLGDD